MTPDQLQRLENIEKLFELLMKSDRYTIQKLLTIFGGVNIQFDTTNGSKIGTSALQKIGFYGVTPIVQPTRPTDAASIITAGTSLGIWA